MKKFVLCLALLLIATPTFAAQLTTKWVVVGWAHQKDPTVGNDVYSIDLQLIPEDPANVGIVQGIMTLRLTNANKANAIAVGDIVQVDLTKLVP